MTLGELRSPKREVNKIGSNLLSELTSTTKLDRGKDTQERGIPWMDCRWGGQAALEEPQLPSGVDVRTQRTRRGDALEVTRLFELSCCPGCSRRQRP